MDIPRASKLSRSVRRWYGTHDYRERWARVYNPPADTLGAYRR